MAPIICKVQHISRTVQQINFNCKLSAPVDHFEMRVIMYKRLGAVYHKFLVDIRENVYSYNNGERKSKLLDMIKSKTQNYTNVFNKCPFKVSMSCRANLSQSQ